MKRCWVMEVNLPVGADQLTTDLLILAESFAMNTRRGCAETARTPERAVGRRAWEDFLAEQARTFQGSTASPRKRTSEWQSPRENWT
jgi:hypothetical protein